MEFFLSQREFMSGLFNRHFYHLRPAIIRLRIATTGQRKICLSFLGGFHVGWYL